MAQGSMNNMKNPFNQLPHEVHGERIVQASVTGDINDVRKARHVCQSFCDHASTVVSTLSCGQDMDITAGAWSSFPSADGLRIDLTKGAPRNLEPALRKLLKRVPSGRLRRFFIVSPGYGRGSEIVKVLCSSSITKHLKQVSIQSAAVLPDEADALINTLPLLEDLELDIKEKSCQWRPAAGQHLRSLKLQRPQPDEADRIYNPTFTLDMQGIAGSTKLQVLHLDCSNISNTEALTSLADLQELLLDVSGTLPNMQAMLQLLQQLPELHTLLLPSNSIYQADDWKALGGMQQLRRLQVNELWLSLDASGRAPSSNSSITDLSVAELRFRDSKGWPVQVPRGFLTRLLPALERCELAAAQCGAAHLAQLLAQHSSLRCATLYDHLRSKFHPWAMSPEHVDTPSSWPAGTCSSWPCLEELKLVNVVSLDLDSLLEELAGCSKLRSVVVGEVDADDMPQDDGVPVEAARYRFSGEGLKALAAGGCRGSLERVVLHSPRSPVPVEALQRLLQAPALQEAAVCVQAGRGWAREFNAQRALLVQQLQRAGCKVEVLEGEAGEGGLPWISGERWVREQYVCVPREHKAAKQAEARGQKCADECGDGEEDESDGDESEDESEDEDEDSYESDECYDEYNRHRSFLMSRVALRVDGKLLRCAVLHELDSHPSNSW